MNTDPQDTDLQHTPFVHLSSLASLINAAYLAAQLTFLARAAEHFPRAELSVAPRPQTVYTLRLFSSCNKVFRQKKRREKKFSLIFLRKQVKSLSSFLVETLVHLLSSLLTSYFLLKICVTNYGDRRPLRTLYHKSIWCNVLKIDTKVGNIPLNSRINAKWETNKT